MILCLGTWSCEGFGVDSGLLERKEDIGLEGIRG